MSQSKKDLRKVHTLRKTIVLCQSISPYYSMIDMVPRFPSGTSAILETPPLPPWRGGGVEKSCVTYEFPGWFCRLFIFLGIRGASSKTIKTSLNCWQREYQMYMQYCRNE